MTTETLHEGETMPEQQPGQEPWWGQARNLIWSLGPVTVAFFGLLAVILGWLPSPMLDGIQTGTSILQQNQKIMADIQREMTRHVERTDQQQIDQIKALRQICRNTSKTPMQNERCDEIQR